ncbi:uncharacterized protein [Atheta coriaria]|uniref:uncharacterized protein isoform X1 n=1 Tax=Dalotia coriaria TaxID=877792 RepID=UPI0031F3A824
MWINVRRHRRINFQQVASFICIFLTILNINLVYAEIWPMERPTGMPSIQSLEVMCGKDHMDVHVSFSQPFDGIVSSKGQHGDPRCVYVPPSTGQTFFSFRIAYARCGTKPDLNGQFYENTVVVQYDKDLLEVWDEAKRLRCEWFNDYEKTATKPPMVIADLDVIQLDFRGDNVDCWMEIQHGKGPWAPPVSGIVPLGSTLTLVVAINDYRGEFDMRVKSCVASDGGGHVIQLSDESGCVLRPKMISRFLKAKGADERASVITYAFFHAFKFPDALSVHIKCKVEICRHGCLDHCQQQPESNSHVEVEHQYGGIPLERKDDGILSTSAKKASLVGTQPAASAQSSELHDDIIYDDIIQEGEGGTSIGSGMPSIKMSLSSHKTDEESKTPPPPVMVQEETESPVNVATVDNLGIQTASLEELAANLANIANVVNSGNGDVPEDLDIGSPLPHKDAYTMEQDKFPHGPRHFDHEEVMPLGAPRSLPDNVPIINSREKRNASSQPMLTLTKRKRRSMVVSDRKVRSADVGVSGLYEVISEADLAFSPDNKAEAVTVFQGKIREEVVYGICMPVPGFSVLFVLVAVSAVVSALVAGSLLYRYQLQREHMVAQAHDGAMAMSTLAYWMGLGFLRTRDPPTCGAHETSAAAAAAAATERLNNTLNSLSMSSLNNLSSMGAMSLNGKTDTLRSRE